MPESPEKIEGSIPNTWMMVGGGATPYPLSRDTTDQHWNTTIIEIDRVPWIIYIHKIKIWVLSPSKSSFTRYDLSYDKSYDQIESKLCRIHTHPIYRTICRTICPVVSKIRTERMDSVSSDELVLLGLVTVCIATDENKSKKRKRERWCKDWLLQRRKFSHTNLFQICVFFNFLKFLWQNFIGFIFLVTVFIVSTLHLPKTRIFPI